MATMLSRRVLSKEEESEATDAEVTKEDQDKINDFSRLHSRTKVLELELIQKQKEKEDLDDVSTELELADEDEPVTYRVGDSFFALPLPEAQETLAADLAVVEEEITALEEERDSIKEETDKLKAHLYARFGRGINLES